MVRTLASGELGFPQEGGRGPSRTCSETPDSWQELHQQGQEVGEGANGTRDQVSTFSLDHPVYTVPTGLSKSQEDNVFLSLHCLDQSGNVCRL